MQGESSDPTVRASPHHPFQTFLGARCPGNSILLRALGQTVLWGLPRPPHPLSSRVSGPLRARVLLNGRAMASRTNMPPLPIGAIDRGVSLRGVGVSAAVLVFSAAGLADGMVALARAPAGELSAVAAARVLFSCVAICALAGVVLGGVIEVFLLFARRLPTLAALGWALADGPPRWFARDPDVSVAVLTAGLSIAAVVVVTFDVTLRVTQSLHSPALISAVVSLVVGTLVPFILAARGPAQRWLASRVHNPRFAASPGAAVLFSVAGLGVVCAPILRAHWVTFGALDGVLLLSCVAVLAGLLVATAAAVRSRVRGVTPQSHAILTVGAAVLAGVVALASVGAWQIVAVTVSRRTVLTCWLVPALRVVVPWRAGEGHQRFDLTMSLTVRERPPTPAVRPTLPRPCVIAITIDALRPDHLGAFGDATAATPHLDALASASARFTRAYTPVPSTVRAFASTWTGMIPSMFPRVTEPTDPGLAPPVPTLASRLGAAGYATVMFADTSYLGQPELPIAGVAEREATGGFAERFPGEVFKDDAMAKAREAVRWIRAHAIAPAPFFTWVHFIEPHQPYRGSPGNHGNRTADEMSRYDREVTAADRAAGVVLDAVNEVAEVRPVVILVFSDHGEALGEHGHNGHAQTLYEEEVRVLLLVRAPGVAAGPRDALVSLVDVTPTVLELVDLPVPEGLYGRSLVPVLRDPRVSGTSAWRSHLRVELPADGNISWDQAGEITPTAALLWDQRGDTWELFDLLSDPVERFNRYDTEPGRVATMRPWLSVPAPSVEAALGARPPRR